MNCVQKCTAKCLLECNQNTVHSAIFLPVCVLIATLSLQVRPNPNSILYPFPLSLETECQATMHQYYTITRDHTSSTHILVCIRELHLYINALLTYTNTHTSEIMHLTHPGAKKPFNAATRLLLITVY